MGARKRKKKLLNGPEQNQISENSFGLAVHAQKNEFITKP